jgi:peptide/nickel transport system substrate-binding protein
VIQANLAEIGITVEILSYEGSTFWNLGLESEGEDWKNLQLYLGQFTSLSDPYLNTQWFTPEQVGVWNWERWNSAEFGDLHKKALGETDPKKRAAMYVKMQDLMEDSGAYVFIAHEPDAAIYRGAIAPALRPDLVVQAKGTRPA